MRALLRGTAVAAALFGAAAAEATPFAYTFQSGSVTLTATINGFQIIAPVTRPLTGTQVTVDEGLLTLNSFLFNIGSSGLIPFFAPVAGYIGLNIDFASASASGGTLNLITVGPPAEYGYLINNVTVSGQFDAVSGSHPLPPNVNNLPFGFVNPSSSGTIFINPGGGNLELDGITIGSITVPGGPAPIVIKGDFVFTGVPEPGTMLLLGSGLAGFAMLRRRETRS